MSRKWTSRKLWSTLIAIALELAIFIYSVHILLGFNNDQDKLIAAWIQMYEVFMVGINATILGYVGINGAVAGVVQWRHGSEAVSNLVSETITSIDLKPRPRDFEKHDEHGDDPLQ